MARRPWGAGSIVPPSTPGGTFKIRYSNHAGNRVSESGFPTRQLASAALAARRTDLAREKIGIPTDLAQLPTIGELAGPWLERRLRSHENGGQDRARWRKHLGPVFDGLRLPELDRSALRSYIEKKRAAGLGPVSVRHHLRLLSGLFEEARERPRETGATGLNPCLDLPESVLAQIRPVSDPRLTPFIQRLEDVRRVYDLLAEPIRTGFAVGVLAGLRTGEVLALRWEGVDLDRRQLIVREAVKHGRAGPLKDKEARILPITPELLPVLRARKLASGGAGLVVPPANPGRRSGPRRLPATFARSQTLNEALHAALVEAGLERKGKRRKAGLDWYRCTRHTYASHYVLGGGSLQHLATLLGHTSAEVTLRYAHLQPGQLAAADVQRIRLDLVSPKGEVARLPGPKEGHGTGTATRHEELASHQIP